MTARAQAAVQDIIESHGSENVVLVTHGDILNRYLPELPAVPGVGLYAPKEAGFAVIEGPHGAIAVEESIIGKHRLDSLM